MGIDEIIVFSRSFNRVGYTIKFTDAEYLGTNCLSKIELGEKTSSNH
jgi:hypothetical protein